jgi:hypothetical protein
MSIVLTPNQKSIIEGAIRAGRVRSVDESIETAVRVLPRTKGSFDAEAARLAGARIRELRKGVTLSRGTMSIRDMAHLGHKY